MTEKLHIKFYHSWMELLADKEAEGMPIYTMNPKTGEETVEQEFDTTPELLDDLEDCIKRVRGRWQNRMTIRAEIRSNYRHPGGYLKERLENYIEELKVLVREGK